MSAAFAAAAPTPPPPDPDQAGAPAYGPRRFASFLRSLIECGKRLSVAVRLRAQRPDFPGFAKPFGTTYLPHILRRFGAAVGRALVLEERSLRQAGAVPTPRVRERVPPEGRTRAAGRHDAGRDAALPEPKRATHPARRSGDPHYADWPSVRQLAADIRRRSVAAVLADICRDLGITPHHELWPEMCEAITAHGGSIAELEQDADERWCSARWLALPFVSPPIWELIFWPAPWSDPVTAAAATATGPP